MSSIRDYCPDCKEMGWACKCRAAPHTDDYCGIVQVNLADFDPVIERVERYEDLILSAPGIVDPESDTFMRGFAYGRFTDIDSELARHWGIGRRFAVHDCPIVERLESNLARAVSRQGDEVERISAIVGPNDGRGLYFSGPTVEAVPRILPFHLLEQLRKDAAALKAIGDGSVG